MIIEITRDVEKIKSVLCDPEIFYKISNGQNIETYEPPLVGCIYLIGLVGEKVIGLSCFHRYEDGLKFHPNVIKRYRAKYGRDFVQKTAYMLKCRLYTKIPESRQGLIKLAKNIGFSEIKRKRESVIMRLHNEFY